MTGRIRRQESKKSSRNYVIAIAVVFVVLVAAYFIFFSAGNQTPTVALEMQTLPDRADVQLLQAVETFPEEGRTHVDQQNTPLDYKTSPPTSGNHFSSPAGAGFYSRAIPYGNLVHTLEHGGVVIYYDPSKLDDATKESLSRFSQVHMDPWASVVALPMIEASLNESVILTAWTKRLRLMEYNAETVRAFMAEFLGRGPENKVR